MEAFFVKTGVWATLLQAFPKYSDQHLQKFKPSQQPQQLTIQVNHQFFGFELMSQNSTGMQDVELQRLNENQVENEQSVEDKNDMDETDFIVNDATFLDFFRRFLFLGWSAF
eukprot:TRINITY_DN96816_c0_g1_i1.p1 TRINITY_DN96816_c0_g1~~TRINITY_DN96816_c0_g1_i1.p1  ORF type:complete len:112 (-),score=14.66 TRINITY_DN96816_c0_g1_i1:71-406(-)